MSGSPLKKFILTPAIISASVFAALTLPLAVLGNQQVTIKLQRDTWFDGKLRDVATPYLGLTAVLSLGAGIASVAVAGWQQSSRKSGEVEAQLSGLAQHLKEKEAQLEALKLSEPRLEASGLKAFLDEEIPLQSTQETPVPLPTSPLVVEEFVITPQPFEVQVMASPSLKVQATTAKFACAQTFLGYAHGKATPKPATRIGEQTHKEVEHLQVQLQHLMAQMASVQAALAATGEAVHSETQVPSNVAPLQVVKAWSVHHKIS
jgi:hypothetical protein